MRYGPDMDRDDLAEMGDEACRSRDIRQGIPVDHDDGDFLNLLASEAHEARLERVNEFSAGNAQLWHRCRGKPLKTLTTMKSENNTENTAGSDCSAATYSVIKRFGQDFDSDGGALTLDPSQVTDTNAESGTHTRTHDSGWTITGELHEDYYVWVNYFTATHPDLGRVEGNFEDEVKATSEEAFAHFWKHHQPSAWDYHDI